MKNVFYIAVITIAFSACRDKGAENAVAEQQRIIDSMKVAMKLQQEELTKQKTIDSMNAVSAAREIRSARLANAGSASTVAVTEKKRKGWSGAAKGAVIGAGAGAITGAAISKKKGQGAIIGGLAGAALGAGTGEIIESSKEKKK